MQKESIIERMDEDITPRVGTFFLIIGFSLIIFFVMSDLGKEIEYNYLLIGLPSIALGFFFRRNVSRSTESSGRFSTWRKWRSGTLKNEMEEHRKAKKAERDAKRAERKASGGGLFRRKKKEE